MKPVRVIPHRLAPKGRVLVMADTTDPNVDLLVDIDSAEKLIVTCHPDDAERVRDVIALEQEAPKWWRDMRRIEAILASPSHLPEEGDHA